MSQKPPEPKGVADAPNMEPMVKMADALRQLAVGEPSRELIIATARAGADIMEMQTDWLVDQHRLIMSQSRSIEQMNQCVQEALALLREARGE